MRCIPITLVLAGMLGACSTVASAPDGQAQQRAFLANLRTLCGASFAGVASIVPADARQTWSGTQVVARVSACTEREVRIPVQVGADHSRTWILRATDAGLVLVHDHRHADGSAAAQSLYGGPAGAGGSAHAQHFSADSYTAGLLPASATNVWHLTLAPDGRALTYYLERQGVPRLKVELRRRE